MSHFIHFVSSYNFCKPVLENKNDLPKKAIRIKINLIERLT